MDYSHVFFSQNNNVTRHLPTYEEANISYSLRLPAYRSSYIRRFHPYARYTTRTTEEQYTGDSHDDVHREETPLDLRILDDPMQVLPTPPAEEERQENLAEEPLIVNPDIPNGDVEEEYGAADGRSRLCIFRRMNIDMV
ncbi:hypothetical protein AX15_006412 [Amanita polypyramis BW_CC]|nr:hypothetical protein AX15_006412 [Amanita polypyramis BW_CC]